MKNPFKSMVKGLISPATGIIDVDSEKDDVASLSYMIRAIRASVGGDIAIVCSDGSEATITVAANETLPIMISQVKATGTTATGLWGYK